MLFIISGTDNVQSEDTNTDVAYSSCADVIAAGKAPLHTGDPGYSFKLDRDKDGVACEAS
ncbi:excalibur calcium-binding domain-containing protein [Paenibacillus solisilvae]|uniref:Excalibur calcium-binding domain-containing protein n=1 Tax=Paenibacillus solisilvae TaxID=2486751 RepID=A0ABW0VXZ4_9BACL